MLAGVLVVFVLLLVGVFLRASSRFVQLLFVPASVIGGIVGLVVIQVCAHWPLWDGLDTAAGSVADTLRGWPGMLIAVVFAGLLLEHPPRRLAESARGTALAAIMVWVIVLGEIFVGLLATWLVIMPVLDVPPAFGQLIEAGFAGGHATAAALGTIFQGPLEFDAGMDLGLFVATIGLVYGVASGIVLVNVAVRRGWTRAGRARAEAGAGRLQLIGGLESRHRPEPIAYGRVRGEVIDPFVFQAAIVAMAFLVGYGMQQGLVAVLRTVVPDESLRYVENVPLFLFTLIGGLLVRRTMTGLGLGDLIDGHSVKRIVAMAMEVLIVAAIASLRLETLHAYLWPITLLLALGAGWTAFCLLVLAPRMLPKAYWFELGILNYGMSTGTTAQGMMLLRIVDPDLESGAAEDYALAAPFSAPFIGGGIITLSLPLIMERAGMAPAVVILAVVLAGLVPLGMVLRRRHSRASSGATSGPQIGRDDAG